MSSQKPQVGRVTAPPGEAKRPLTTLFFPVLQSIIWLMETHPHGATSLLPQLRVLSQLAQTPDAALLGGCCSRSVASAVSDSATP